MLCSGRSCVGTQGRVVERFYLARTARGYSTRSYTSTGLLPVAGFASVDSIIPRMMHAGGVNKGYYGGLTPPQALCIIDEMPSSSIY
eukprot:5668719-Pleurochrysis_carterae.AAC.1